MTGKPNILFINTDQQTWNAISAYANPHVRTPHIDRLADEGVTTEQFTDRLLTEHGIVALPGAPAFPSTAGEGYLRMNYALPQATLEKGIAKLETALSG